MYYIKIITWILLKQLNVSRLRHCTRDVPRSNSDPIWLQQLFRLLPSRIIQPRYFSCVSF